MDDPLLTPKAILKPDVNSVTTTGVANVCTPKSVSLAAASVQLSEISLLVSSSHADITSPLVN